MNFPSWDHLDTVDVSGSFWDNLELSHLNQSIVKTMLNLKEVSRQLTEYERKLTTVSFEHKKKYRNALLNANAKTETQKKLLAEIECEDLEWKISYYNEIIKELNRIAMVLRMDLDVYKTVGHNLRQEMRM